MDAPTSTDELEALLFNKINATETNENQIAFNRWYSKQWASYWTIWMAGDFPDLNVPVDRDDRARDAACYAAFKSFKDVIEQLHQPSSLRYFSAKKPIKSLCKRLLASFDLVCKDLLIETSADAVTLKETIQIVANLVEEHIRQHKYASQLPDAGSHFDDDVLALLQVGLRGKIIPMDITRSKATLDDDLVGIEGDMKEIKEQLLGPESKLRTVPIVGMGGIGKTALARRIYEDPQIVHHFHVRAWVIASLEYRERDILLSLLESIASLAEEVYKEDNGDLAQRLFRRLKGQRYLIVIDDIWTPNAWDDVKVCFPDDKSGSRILLTSRVVELASYINPDGPIHFINFLGLEDSWDLLRKRVFGQEVCPSQLAYVGKRIAEKCQGLPLAIKVMAGHLSSISKTKDCWNNVAETVGLSAEVTQMESVINILSFSYNNLPHHLKACFLSLVTFPRNYEFQARELILLWTSMGFWNPKSANNVEEVAESCLEDLTSRNLIMVREKKFDSKISLCAIHDLLWDLSMSEARKDGDLIFGHSPLSHAYFHTGDDMKYVMGLTHSLLYLDESFESDCPISSAGFKLLKVLDIVYQPFDNFPVEITELVNLRYLSLITGGDIPASVAKLSNLEILIIFNNDEEAGPSLPKEIWLLARLRHLYMETFTCMPDPPSGEIEGSRTSVVCDLQTLKSICSSSCTKEVFLQIRSLKELGIHENEDDDIGNEIFNSLSNVVFLDKLQKLKLRCNVEVEKPRHIPQWNSFIPSIQHLVLIGSNLPWSEINALAVLPNLAVLKLKQNATVGEEWEMDEVFLQLKYLLLESLDLECWKLNADHLPNLQRLVIKECAAFGEVPIELGEIPTLQLIDVDYCSLDTISSLKHICKEQQEMGNDKFTIREGYVHSQHQLGGFFLAFVYMDSLLKMKRDRNKRKGKKLLGKQKFLVRIL